MIHQGGGGKQGSSQKTSVLYNTDRVCKSGLLAVKETVNGFNSPSIILIDIEAKSNYTRRGSLEGSQPYPETRRAQDSDTITTCLTTGT